MLVGLFLGTQQNGSLGNRLDQHLFSLGYRFYGNPIILKPSRKKWSSEAIVVPAICSARLIDPRLKTRLPWENESRTFGLLGCLVRHG